MSESTPEAVPAAQPQPEPGPAAPESESTGSQSKEGSKFDGETLDEGENAGENTGEKTDANEPKNDTPAIKPQASDIPNGGFVAWYQVLGSFFLFFNCWGIVNSYGVYQTYYTLNLSHEANPSVIAWVGSIQAFLLVSVGVVTGPLYDFGYFRTLIFVGSFLVVFGMMMTSLCTHYWQVMLAQGLVVGFGSGCLFVPSVAILPTYFSTKKAFAQGLAASGSSLGGVIYPVIFRQLQPTVGFGWATRVIAFVMLATLIVPLAGMKMRVKPSARRQMFEAAAWKEPPFTLFSIGEFFGFMGMYIPFFYLQSYAIQLGISDENMGFYLLVFLNAGSVFGRIIPNFLADKTGCFNMLIPTSAIAAILAFIWIGIRNQPGLIVFALLYGFFSGTFVSLPPTTVVTLSPSLGVVGVRMGMNFFLASIGLLVGTPIAGAILTHGWAGLQAWGAACVAIATLCMIGARVTKAGWGLMKKC